MVSKEPPSSFDAEDLGRALGDFTCSLVIGFQRAIFQEYFNIFQRVLGAILEMNHSEAKTTPAFCGLIAGAPSIQAMLLVGDDIPRGPQTFVVLYCNFRSLPFLG